MQTIEQTRTQIWQGSQLAFVQAAEQGFGDRQNTWAWTMCWWKGKLYVGTNRAWHCAERAGIHSAFPFIVKYPPADPDADCTPDPKDLPLQAEIWCWAPETDTWERLYQSPKDVPIPGHAGRFTAREIGFREMVIYSEPDGTEAMYVSGVNTKFIFRPVPAPRLLRSTDGVHFEPIPQEPGTFMGDLGTCTLRTISIYKNRMFVITGSIRGDGIVIESANPSAGNDHFRKISPEGTSVFEMTTFNGFLYLGIREARGYSIIKTDATGSLPYTFKTIVPKGGYLPKPSMSVISMYEFQGRLYVGTDRPGEVIRINPDDSWELVMGTPRLTPEGWKYPISGLDVGFGNWLNGHIWRMCEHDGQLYIGTWNMATEFRMGEEEKATLEPSFGFDLFETADGRHFAPITTNGFQDRFNYGLRAFASTPHGLFLGTANKWYGLQIWRGGQKPEETVPAPKYLQAETQAGGNEVLLSWLASPGAEQYRVYRAAIKDERKKVEANWLLKQILRVARAMQVVMPDLYIPSLPKQLWIPGEYKEMGRTEQTFFRDPSAVAGQRYQYFVRAEDVRGVSASSNLVAVPSLSPPVTFEWVLTVEETSVLPKPVVNALLNARESAQEGNLAQAEQQLLDGINMLNHETSSILDLKLLLVKLQIRLRLCREGWLDGSALL